MNEKKPPHTGRTNLIYMFVGFYSHNSYILDFSFLSLHFIQRSIACRPFQFLFSFSWKINIFVSSFILIKIFLFSSSALSPNPPGSGISNRLPIMALQFPPISSSSRKDYWKASRLREADEGITDCKHKYVQHQRWWGAYCTRSVREWER